MQELLNLLKDGHSRSLEMLAEELHTTTEDIKRRIEFLEHSGLIRRLGNIKDGQSHSSSNCSNCKSNKKCGSKEQSCSGCLPEDGFKNMGQKWEVL